MAPHRRRHLTDLDEVLDGLVRGWTDTLRSNLEDPTVSGNIDLVSDAAGKGELQGFLKSKQLPDPVSPAFVKALQEVLSGLQKVSFGNAALQAALSDGGLPAPSAICVSASTAMSSTSPRARTFRRSAW